MVDRKGLALPWCYLSASSPRIPASSPPPPQRNKSYLHFKPQVECQPSADGSSKKHWHSAWGLKRR
eukprot:5748847-Pleurochrysis_carterae.AAC.2